MKRKGLGILFIFLAAFCTNIWVAGCGGNNDLAQNESGAVDKEQEEEQKEDYKEPESGSDTETDGVNGGEPEEAFIEEAEFEGEFSTNLKFELSSDGEYYKVIGIEAGYEAQVFIPAIYDGKSVKEIREGAFADNGKIEEALIPDSVTKIGGSAFKKCGSLKSIVFYGSASQWSAVEKGENWNDGTGDYTVRYASEGLEFTKSADGKSCYLSGMGSCRDSVVVMPVQYDGLPVKGVGDKAFFNCGYIERVYIGEGVSNIGSYALGYCSKLEHTFMSYSVTRIGGEAFYYCGSLTHVKLPDGVRVIGEAAFWGCNKLEEIDVPSGVKTVKEQTFGYCRSLTAVGISGGITALEKGAFEGCSALADINFDGTKAQWNAVNKVYGWNALTGGYTVHCTDGDVVK